jgi:hypothetical protein
MSSACSSGPGSSQYRDPSCRRCCSISFCTDLPCSFFSSFLSFLLRASFAISRDLKMYQTTNKTRPNANKIIATSTTGPPLFSLKKRLNNLDLLLRGPDLSQHSPFLFPHGLKLPHPPSRSFPADPLSSSASFLIRIATCLSAISKDGIKHYYDRNIEGVDEDFWE